MIPTELKSHGMSLALQANRQWLQKARQIAIRVGEQNGYCSIEDVRRNWIYQVPFGNWSGSIFKMDCWVFDRYIKTEHEKGHSRPVVLWRFVNSALSQSALPVVDQAKKNNPVKQSELFQIESNQHGDITIR